MQLVEKNWKKQTTAKWVSADKLVRVNNLKSYFIKTLELLTLSYFLFFLRFLSSITSKNVGLSLTCLCGDRGAQLYSVVGWWPLRCNLSFWVCWGWGITSDCLDLSRGSWYNTTHCQRSICLQIRPLLVHSPSLRDSTFPHQGSWEHMKKYLTASW